MQTDQCGRGPAHCVDVELPSPREDVAPPQWLDAPLRDADPVAVVPPEGREPGIETDRGGGDRAHAEIGR